MGFLNREALLKKAVLKIEKVDLGGGDHVFVREMTASERDSYEVSLVNDSGNVKSRIELKDFRANLCIRSICNEKGDLILKQEDKQSFSDSMSASKMNKIFEAAKKISELSENPVTEQEKN